MVAGRVAGPKGHALANQYQLACAGAGACMQAPFYYILCSPVPFNTSGMDPFNTSGALCPPIVSALMQSLGESAQQINYANSPLRLHAHADLISHVWLTHADFQAAM